VQGAKQLLQKIKMTPTGQEDTKKENNMKEMSFEQTEQVSGGKGPGWSLKDLWPKIKSWFTDNEDKER
jgi:hypothetical protein